MTRRFIINCLRVLLVIALFGAGWGIYRRLPVDDGASLFEANEAGAARETELVIMLRRAPNVTGGDSSLAIPVEIYSVDVAEVQRELVPGRQTAEQLDAFVKRRMGQPVKTRLDERGQAIVRIRPGKWWVHATLAGPPELGWQLPISVAGRTQTVELTAENAYTRAKTF
ncbi:MAG TPA: hypothetical protein VM870_03150 [Pyrinomonadaceae bacterium]|nr:hypothetical protein [Pyrinomonadaceae bacterium]